MSNLGVGDHLFKRALPVAGVLHMVSTCSEVLQLNVFQHWNAFREQLTAITNLLCTPHLLELFLQRCIRNTPFESYEKAFSKAFPRVVEWRWASLTQALGWLLPLRGPLQAAWNADAWVAGFDPEKQAANKFQTLRLAIPSPFFWAYAHMIQHLQLGLDKISFWAENCPCHEKMPRSGNSNDRLVGTMREETPSIDVWQALMPDRKVSKSLWASCPMRGKRAPELAAGLLQRQLDEVLRTETLHLVAQQREKREGGSERGRLLRLAALSSSSFQRL